MSLIFREDEQSFIPLRDDLPRFCRGQVVRHELFGYRGVIVSVDAGYGGAHPWYERIARTQPPRDRPWYGVLVAGTMHQTYVAQRNLALDVSPAPVDHPDVHLYFDGVRDGRYVLTRAMN